MDKKEGMFKYGDLVIVCHKCGGIQVMEEMIETGRAVYMFNTVGNGVKLHCPECDITMEMCILPNEKANQEFDEALAEIKTDEEFQEEGPTKEVV